MGSSSAVIDTNVNAENHPAQKPRKRDENEKPIKCHDDLLKLTLPTWPAALRQILLILSTNKVYSSPSVVCGRYCARMREGRSPNSHHSPPFRGDWCAMNAPLYLAAVAGTIAGGTILFWHNARPYMRTNKEQKRVYMFNLYPMPRAVEAKRKPFLGQPFENMRLWGRPVAPVSQ